MKITISRYRRLIKPETDFHANLFVARWGNRKIADSSIEDLLKSIIKIAKRLGRDKDTLTVEFDVSALSQNAPAQN